MLIQSDRQGFNHPLGSEVTPEPLYRSRRDLIRSMAAGAAGMALAGWASREALAQAPGRNPVLAHGRTQVSGAISMDKLTEYQLATSYNNFYEFGTDKADPERYAQSLKTSPWTVEVEGLVNKPARYALEDLLKFSAQEERIYRLRCVEGWSMVIPWVGYSLADLIRRVEPQPGAKYVEFITQADEKTMPGVRSGSLEWPYVEGLRMDEAMHPLSLLAFGMYGEVMPKQNGAPVRLVVPWKYGFKSAKSLVKIRFVDKQPVSSWTRAAQQEYGFYSNVNPQVDHPRWSQATERRIGGEGGVFSPKIKTLPFNGYDQQVSSLYAGMDLRKFY